MKIREKAKTFVQKHKGKITAGIICGGIGLVGFAFGRKFALDGVEGLTGIDLKKDGVIYKQVLSLKDICKDGSIPDAYKQAGFASLEDSAKMVALVQKQ